MILLSGVSYIAIHILISPWQIPSDGHIVLVNHIDSFNHVTAHMVTKKLYLGKQVFDLFVVWYESSCCIKTAITLYNGMQLYRIHVYSRVSSYIQLYNVLLYITSLPRRSLMPTNRLFALLWILLYLSKIIILSHCWDK